MHNLARYCCKFFTNINERVNDRMTTNLNSTHKKTRENCCKWKITKWWNSFILILISISDIDIINIPLISSISFDIFSTSTVHRGLDYNSKWTKIPPPPKKKNHRLELKTTYKARRHLYRDKTNVFSYEHVHSTAYSVLKAALSKNYWFFERGAVWVGIQHQPFRRWYSHVCLVTKMFLSALLNTLNWDILWF